MAAQVLGISGSPIANSNTDRAVQYVLQHTGLETEFVKLSDLKIEPCRACLGCKDSNECVVQDDGRAVSRTAGKLLRTRSAFRASAFWTNFSARRQNAEMDLPSREFLKARTPGPLTSAKL